MAKVDLDVGSFEPNSHAHKREVEDKKKGSGLTPVIQKDSIVSTKKSAGRKIADSFLSAGGDELKTYILKDLVIPGLKSWAISALKMAFFHEEYDPYYDRRDTGRSSYGGRHYDYSSRYRDRDDRSTRDRDRSYRDDDKIDYRHIVVDRRIDAEKVVDILHDQIYDQGYATVADLFNLVGLEDKYTDNNWGWRRINDISIRRVASGFLINVREAEYVGE